jgi:hypothetical protein
VFDDYGSGVIRCVTLSPSTKKQTAFRIEPEILQGMQRVKARDGVPLSEQVRRALMSWLEMKGAMRPERKQAPPRKRVGLPRSYSDGAAE